MIPVLLLVAVELILKILGQGQPPDFFKPASQTGRIIPNPAFIERFYGRRTSAMPDYAEVLRSKPPGIRRVFVFGESAALGTPEPAFGFARQLQLMLDHLPGKARIEIINTAMRGIDSFVQRAIASECATLEPDVFLIYAGHNEMIGLHGADPFAKRLAYSRAWILGAEFVTRTRAGWLLSRVLRGGGGPRRAEQDAEVFHRHATDPGDWRRNKVRTNFRANLEFMCETGLKAGARVVLCTVASNVKSFPPVTPPVQGQQYPPPDAASPSEELATLELRLQASPRDAVLHYRRGTCLLKLGKTEDGLAALRLARDLDRIPVRAEGALNEITREVAAARASRGVVLVDLEREIEKESAECFHDHVHFNLRGDHAIASRLRLALEDVLGLPVSPSQKVDLEWIRARVAYTPVDEINVREAVLTLLRGAPFNRQWGQSERDRVLQLELLQLKQGLARAVVDRAERTHRQAIRDRPGDWRGPLRLGLLLQQVGRPAEAVEHVRGVVQQHPDWVPFRVELAGILFSAEDHAGAKAELALARSLDPGDVLLTRVAGAR
jgi:tetratricopeptide (TPR) repeat protein